MPYWITLFDDNLIYDQSKEIIHLLGLNYSIGSALKAANILVVPLDVHYIRNTHIVTYRTALSLVHSTGLFSLASDHLAKYTYIGNSWNDIYIYIYIVNMHSIYYIYYYYCLRCFSKTSYFPQLYRLWCNEPGQEDFELT